MSHKRAMKAARKARNRKRREDLLLPRPVRGLRRSDQTGVVLQHRGGQGLDLVFLGNPKPAEEPN
jgi:hypothetical protein